jgi:hypothetical protein
MTQHLRLPWPALLLSVGVWIVFVLVLLVFTCAAHAQPHAQPWHDPYVGQLVTCKAHPRRLALMLATYTFTGDDLHEFVVKRASDGCPLRVEIKPRPQPASAPEYRK